MVTIRVIIDVAFPPPGPPAPIHPGRALVVTVQIGVEPEQDLEAEPMRPPAEAAPVMHGVDAEAPHGDDRDAPALVDVAHPPGGPALVRPARWAPVLQPAVARPLDAVANAGAAAPPVLPVGKDQKCGCCGEVVRHRTTGKCQKIDTCGNADHPCRHKGTGKHHNEHRAEKEHKRVRRAAAAQAAHATRLAQLMWPGGFTKPEPVRLPFPLPRVVPMEPVQHDTRPIECGCCEAVVRNRSTGRCQNRRTCGRPGHPCRSGRHGPAAHARAHAHAHAPGGA